ncbi:RHS repeat protein [Rhodanobacter sp. T12-5]|uniref:RHS repeat-associated core domain-containing protein n=1 Tax=Rhodanobacter sp. T12-5 TaxID=2024611 RepID=UPI001561BE96|nr:RHS repeat protein [Rhodanobacter sp. T12-5]
MESRKNTHTRIKLLPALVLAALSLAGRTACAGSPTVTQYTYDKGGYVASVTDPRNLVTSYAHDGLGQLWQQVSPDTGTTSFTYDSYGRRSGMTRAGGMHTSYAYDTLNRPISVSAGGQTQSFTYDSCTNGVGRLCTDSDAMGATSYSYTPEGRVAGRGFAMSGTTYALGYAYDAMGHVATVTYPDGNQANYTYAEGVVSGVSLKIGGSVVNGATAIAYRPGDLAMATWTSGNGLVNTLSYDTDGRLTGISVPGVQSLGFSYDSADRIIQISNGLDINLTQDFGYGDQSRLLSVYSSADNESFQYDANGNRLAQTGTIDTVSATSNRLLSSGSSQYGYDAQGNTTTVNGASTYHYDAFNRMDSAAGMAYYVNPEGQRLRKTGSAGTTYFAPDRGGSLLAEDPNSSWIDYVWLNGRLIGRMAGGQVYAIHDDQTGRPEVMTNASRQVVWQAQNFAFTQNVTVANVTLNLGFPGQYYDAETATWNNGYRDYQSRLGRYVESDPIGQRGGINTYAYAGGNPLVYTDPTGTTIWHVGIFVAGFDSPVGGVTLGRFQAISECENGKIGFAQGTIGSLGSDFGGKAGFIGYTVDLDDGLNYVDPSVLNGLYVSEGGGIVIGGGVTYGNVRLGGARGTFDLGAAGGLSMGEGADFGVSHVTMSSIIPTK